MIELRNGYQLQYVVASGALAFDGKGWWPFERLLVWLGIIKPELFTVVTKTITLHPREGNFKWWKPWECFRLIPGGSVNKMNLTNKGLDWWLEKVAPTIDFNKYKIVVSIYGTKEELVAMVRKLNKLNIVAVEVNFSCPSTEEGFCPPYEIFCTTREVSLASIHPLIAKLSSAQEYVVISRLIADYVGAISLNSVPWEKIYTGFESPLHKLQRRVGGGGGGVSGRPAQNENWLTVLQLCESGTVPVIAPSIMDYGDVGVVRKLGAGAVSFGAIHIRTPWKPTQIVKRLMGESCE